MEREHDQDRDQSLQPLGLSRDSMRQALIYTLTKAICFADSAMIMHVVPETQKFLHAASGIYRELLYNVYGGARVTDVP